MSVQTVQAGMSPIEERVIAKSSHSMSITANNQQQIDTVAHPFKVTPFYDYMISSDNGVTFYPPSQFQTIDSLIYVDMFADKNNLYFSYHYSSASPVNPALSLVFKYRLFITEAKR